MLGDRQTLGTISAAIRARLDDRAGGLLVVGLCGAQGSGKSTLADALAQQFEREAIATAILSIDDLYRTKAEREALARDVHPLLRTRGVPGTHDVELGLSVLKALDVGRSVALPRFDKSIDDRAPPAAWYQARAGIRLLILEGWCVGARPERPVGLTQPINALEREEDQNGTWRGYVNSALGNDYQRLFGRIDLLVLLAVPDFETVFRWRIEQELELRAETGRGMTNEEVTRFVRHYERLTRHILAEMRTRADLLIYLNEDRAPLWMCGPDAGHYRRAGCA